jgi:putative transposase
VIIIKVYTKDEKATIKRLMKTTKNTVMQRKYLVIHLHMRGYKNNEIAPIVSLNQQTVGIYVNTYNNLGLDGLIPKKPPGRPCLLTNGQELDLYNTVSQNTPDEVGFDGRKNWTASLACSWVEQKFSVKYSINGMLDLFHRLNLSYTRPTYVLAKADLEKQEEFKRDFDAQKKTLK